MIELSGIDKAALFIACCIFIVGVSADLFDILYSRIFKE